MDVDVRLLGGFVVSVDGVAVPESAWSRRHAASLVKLLCLTDGRRLHRERVIEHLWPGLTVEAAAPRLHKAAHYARRALGSADAVQLRQDTVALLPDASLHVDLDELLGAGRAAVASGDPAAAEAALASYGGVLLPDDLYEPWTESARGAAAAVHVDLLRLARRWEDLLQQEPADEEAHLALARASAERGDVRAALRQLERLAPAPRRELGTTSGPEVHALRARLESTAPTPPEDTRERVRLVGRKETGDVVRDRLERTSRGRGGALLRTGPPGVGKSALLDLAEALATRRGFRVGRGSAAAVEGPWPYAPVLEALSDLCRKHPALLDGLGDVYRAEIERALSGREQPWTGESAHQRLFVAAAELVRLAAAGHGLLLVVDDLHEADEASFRLLHYLARLAATEPVLVLLAHRPASSGPVAGVLASLGERTGSERVEVPPLSAAATRRLVSLERPDLPADTVDHIVAVSAGLPFAALEMARSADAGGVSGLGAMLKLPPPVLHTFRRVALLGNTFTTDELVAVADCSEAEAYHRLEAALVALLVEPTDAGHRFRHPQLREALVEQMPSYDALVAHREIAERLAELGAHPARVAHQFLAADLPRRAVPYVVRAVDAAGALGAYRDALALIDGVLEHATGEDLTRLLARRGDLLMAVGDPAAVTAYLRALPSTTGTENRLVRARLARAATFAGDTDTARAALAGLEVEGDAADGPLLMARGNIAYFSGDIDLAWEIAGQARELLQLADDSSQILDLVSLQGLIAHQRGEWFERFRQEMRRTHGKERLATALFDAHLCVAEYMLYGQVPYAEVISQAEDLRAQAAHTGALRGVAFATALVGEAALLMGDLERAERELTESVELHRDIDAPAGEAVSLQRLAEVRLMLGDGEGARALLRRALPLARWSTVVPHLLQRVYGTMIQAAATPSDARVVVDLAEAALGENDRCPFCDVMLAVPASIACADVGDVVDARRHLDVARAAISLWDDTACGAAVLEAEAHLAIAEGSREAGLAKAATAAALFDVYGQPLHAARCRAVGTETPGHGRSLEQASRPAGVAGV